MGAAKQCVDVAKQRIDVAKQSVDAAQHWAPEICLLFTSSAVTANTFYCRSHNHRMIQCYLENTLENSLENTPKCIFRLGITVDIHYS